MKFNVSIIGAQLPICGSSEWKNVAPKQQNVLKNKRHYRWPEDEYIHVQSQNKNQFKKRSATNVKWRKKKHEKQKA